MKASLIRKGKFERFIFGTDTTSDIDRVNNSLKIMTTLFCKIPPILPFPKGGIIPSWAKRNKGRFSE